MAIIFDSYCSAINAVTLLCLNTPNNNVQINYYNTKLMSMTPPKTKQNNECHASTLYEAPYNILSWRWESEEWGGSWREKRKRWWRLVVEMRLKLRSHWNGIIYESVNQTRPNNAFNAEAAPCPGYGTLFSSPSSVRPLKVPLPSHGWVSFDTSHVANTCYWW